MENVEFLDQCLESDQSVQRLGEAVAVFEGGPVECADKIGHPVRIGVAGIISYGYGTNGALADKFALTASSVG